MEGKNLRTAKRKSMVCVTRLPHDRMLNLFIHRLTKLASRVSGSQLSRAGNAWYVLNTNASQSTANFPHSLTTRSILTGDQAYCEAALRGPSDIQALWIRPVSAVFKYGLSPCTALQFSPLFRHVQGERAGENRRGEPCSDDGTRVGWD